MKALGLALGLTALVASPAVAADWILWENERGLWGAPPPYRTVSAHPDQATCMAAALTHATARNDQGVPAWRRSTMTQEEQDRYPVGGGKVFRQTTGQGYLVFLDSKPTVPVAERRSLTFLAECWPTGVTPR
jgi:hypothetical protein